MDVIREGLITKRLENLETKISEAICLELTVSNKKWFILFAYRPPQENNKYVFLCVDPDKDRNNYLCDFVDTFSLPNLINKKHVTKIYLVQQLI